MRFLKNIWFALVVILVTSCAGQKKVLYFQDLSVKDTMAVKRNYEMKISYDDLLSITVSSSSPELTVPFMLQSASSLSSSSLSSNSLNLSSSSQNSNTDKSMGSGTAEYLVDAEGNIAFPILGTLHVEGMTRIELMEYIEQRLIKEEYIKDPTVMVKFLNFKICMLGAVGSPGVINVPSEKITILEAIGQTGDLPLTARRDRVLVLREENGTRIPYYVNLKTKDIFNSPCYYLKQNDIVYVEPNRAGTRASKLYDFTNISSWTSLVSLAASIVTVAIVSD